MGPSSETVQYDAAKLGALSRGSRMKVPKKKTAKKPGALANRLTSMRTAGAFTPANKAGC